MGAGISENYENIEESFTTGFWKVHSAFNKVSKMPVSLWMFDRALLKKAVKSSSERDRYMSAVIQSVSQMRRLHHPSILKVIEVSENPKNFGFASEEVTGTLVTDLDLNLDDITYIALQLAQALDFVHSTAKLLNLTLSADTVCITKSINVKLCAFTFSTPITGESVDPQFGPYSVTCGPSLQYTAPEYLHGEQVSTAADIFSYGATMLRAFEKQDVFESSTIDEQMAAIDKKLRKMPVLQSDAMAELLEQCINPDAVLRPTIEQILKSRAFLQLSIRSLRYLDVILTKDNKDKYNFYRGLLNSLSLFSDRLLRDKMLPLFVNEIVKEPVFAPALLPLICTIGKQQNKQFFMRAIIIPLTKVLRMTTPEEVAVANLACIPTFIEMIEPEAQPETLSPMFISCLQSSSSRLRNEALKYIPMMVSSMTEVLILTSLLPVLVKFLEEIDDHDILSSVVDSITECTAKVDHNKFAEKVIPKIMLGWVRVRHHIYAQAVCRLCQRLTLSSVSRCRYIMPMVADMMAYKGMDPTIIEELGNIMHRSVDYIMEERSIVDRVVNWTPAQQPEVDPMVAPIQVQHLDLTEMEEKRKRDSREVQQVPVESESTKSALSEHGTMEKSLFGHKSEVQSPKVKSSTKPFVSGPPVPPPLTAYTAKFVPPPEHESPVPHQAPVVHHAPAPVQARPVNPPVMPAPAPAPQASLFSGMSMGGGVKKKPNTKKQSLF